MSSTKLDAQVNSTRYSENTGYGVIPTDSFSELGTNPTTSGSDHTTVEPLHRCARSVVSSRCCYLGRPEKTSIDGASRSLAMYDPMASPLANVV